MENRAAIGAISIRCIPERSELLLIRCERLPGMFRGLLEHNDHEGPHEECAVCLLVKLASRVVKELHILVPLVSKQPAELPDELVHLCEVARPEVLVERLVHEFLKRISCLLLTLSTLKKKACE